MCHKCVKATQCYGEKKSVILDAREIHMAFMAAVEDLFDRDSIETEDLIRVSAILTEVISAAADSQAKINKTILRSIHDLENSND